MKKVLLGLSLMMLALGGMTVNAQNILDPEDENNLSNFYTRKITMSVPRTGSAVATPSHSESPPTFQFPTSFQSSGDSGEFGRCQFKKYSADIADLTLNRVTNIMPTQAVLRMLQLPILLFIEILLC